MALFGRASRTVVGRLEHAGLMFNTLGPLTILPHLQSSSVYYNVEVRIVSRTIPRWPLCLSGREGLGARRVCMQYMSIPPLCPSMYIMVE